MDGAGGHWVSSELVHSGVGRVPLDRLDVEVANQEFEVLDVGHEAEESFDRPVGRLGRVVDVAESGGVAAETAGEGEEQDVGLCVDGRVKGQLKS